MSSVSDNFPDISFIDDATVDEVLTQMINDYQEKYKELTGKDVSLSQADPYRLIMYACTMQIYQAMQYADYSGKMSFLKYANGDYLDNLAALRGISRIEATAATTVMQFSISSAISSVVSIPAGTKVTNGNDVYFVTDEYAEIAKGETSVSVPATCTTAGTVGNGFTIGELNVLVNTLPYISDVRNTVTTYGGADREDDESLKDRVYSISNSYSTAGPTGAYEYYVKLVDPTINDVIVNSPSAGVVEIRFICDDGEIPSEALMDKVTDYMNDRAVRPLTDNIVVKAPDIQSYDIELTYYIPSSSKSQVSTIQGNIDTAVKVYNMWQTEKIGRDINPSYLIHKVIEAGAKRVDIVSPTFAVVPETAIAKVGTVTVNYGGLEDD